MQQFFVLMLDYGRDGREAICDPEETRSGIVAEVRDVLAKNRCSIAFIWNVREGEVPEDITDEIVAEALGLIGDDAAEYDHQAARFDHARKLRAEA